MGSGELLERDQPAENALGGSGAKTEIKVQHPPEESNDELYAILYGDHEDIWTIYRGVWKCLFDQTIELVVLYLLPVLQYFRASPISTVCC